MPRGIENAYASHMDKEIHKPSENEIVEQGLLAEELVVDAINSGLTGFEARMSTLNEDSGVKDIGMRQVIDAVAYKEGRAVMGIQITTAQDPKVRQKKMLEMMNQPFMRLEEMKKTDSAIPRVLVYLNREMAQAYKDQPDLSKSPEVVLQIIDGITKSLQFDLTKTKNPQEQLAIRALIKDLTQEKEKLVH